VCSGESVVFGSTVPGSVSPVFVFAAAVVLILMGAAAAALLLASPSGAGKSVSIAEIIRLGLTQPQVWRVMRRGLCLPRSRRYFSRGS
jgi:hypothetical protein